eukprot:1160981-Pelagomonas_calceolata.AAC.2
MLPIALRLLDGLTRNLRASQCLAFVAVSLLALDAYDQDSHDQGYIGAGHGKSPLTRLLTTSWQPLSILHHAHGHPCAILGGPCCSIAPAAASDASIGCEAKDGWQHACSCSAAPAATLIRGY